jgi:hypothetical protein
VAKEFDLALAQKKLIPLLTDDAEIPVKYSKCQWVSLRGISKLSYGGDLPGLIRTLACRLGVPPRFDNVEALVAYLVDDGFEFFRVGNIIIPAKCILGSPLTPFSPEEVLIYDQDVTHHERPEYPSGLRDNYSLLLDGACKSLSIDLAKVRDNRLPRLDHLEQAAEGQQDERGPLTLHFSRTSYLQIWATNVAIDVPYFDQKLNASTTIRQQLCFPPYDDSYLSRSSLANNPGVEVVLVTYSDEQTPMRQVIVRKRKATVAGYRGWYQSSASGHLSCAHINDCGVPCPFAAAISETRQEIADSLELEPRDYRLIGILLKEQDLHPSFFGYIETNRPAEDLLNDFRRDDYEGKLSSIPFEPDTVMKHIADNPWFPLSALTMVATLRAFFPYSEVLRAAKAVSPKGVDEFCLKENRVTDPQL